MSDQLDLVAEMGRDFAASMDIESTLRLGLERIANTMDAEGGALFLLDDGEKNLVCEASYGPVDITGLTLGAAEGIVGRTVTNDVSEIVRDVSKDPNFDQSVDEGSGFTTRSILCAPLSVKDQHLGAIEMVNKKGGDGLFTDGDLSLLATLATSAGLAILNARMAEELVEKEKMRRELELAGEIQRSLLPPPAEDAAFPVAGINLPARVVSGDFFDFFTLEDGRIAFTLADVSGKGMNASLMMAKTASLFRCLGKERPYPGQLLARINTEINETAARGMFVTMLAGIYDPQTGCVRFANAGHEPPLFFARDGSITDYPADMPPVGILPDLAGDGVPPEMEVALDGGAFYVFTDGVTEGYIAEGVELGSDGFQKMIREGADALPGARIEAIANRVKAVGPTLRDDLTILVIDDGAAAAHRIENPPPATAVVHGDNVASLSVGARAENLKLVRRLVEASATSCGFSKDTAHDVVLAVDEACQNVIRHAYGGRDDGEMIIEVGRDGSEFLVKIRDFAPTIDPATVKPRDLDDVRPGGLGTHFIREVMDDVTFIAPPDKTGNLLVLKKSLT